MDGQKKKIRLGFTDQEFEAGAHVCQIFSDDEERQNAMVNYLVAGIKNGEKTSCFTEKETKESLSEFFAKQGISYEEIESSEMFNLSKTGEVYFDNDEFEPARMLELLKSFYATSVEDKNTGARVIGEMTPQIQDVKGGSRLLEYESKVSLLLKTHPVTAVCQYDARQFDGATIMDVLKVHPYMIVKGSVVNNPFFIPPEEYLAKNNIEKE